MTAYEKFRAKCDAYGAIVGPLVTPRPKTACWLWHRWGKWEPVIKHFKKWMLDNQWHTHEERWQQRQCQRCGRIEEERI